MKTNLCSQENNKVSLEEKEEELYKFFQERLDWEDYKEEKKSEKEKA